MPQVQERMTEEQINRWLLEDALWYHYKGQDEERDRRLYRLLDRVITEETEEAHSGKT